MWCRLLGEAGLDVELQEASNDTARVAMQVEDQSLRLPAIKMKPIDTNAWCRIKKQFIERDIVLKMKISF